MQNEMPDPDEASKTASGHRRGDDISEQSKRDFVHKLGICLKEIRESNCWLRLIMKTELLPHPRVVELLDEGQQLCAIIAKSIVTAKTKREA
jgi:four helix bundle protein